ncbi:hypothetical protein J25TS5_38360 [Paenibacillus faecis]|nr:hypothetical protein J25TS5_38360 [Paenibacillus faecis]
MENDNKPMLKLSSYAGITQIRFKGQYLAGYNLSRPFPAPLNYKLRITIVIIDAAPVYVQFW